MTNESVYDDIIEMKIDEEKLYRLTKYKGKEIKETDHNTIIIEINDARQQQKEIKESYGTQKIKMAGNYTKKKQKEIKIWIKHGKVRMCRKNGKIGWRFQTRSWESP